MNHTNLNTAAINELADFLANDKFTFDMGESTANPACGSAGCIGGHAAVMWPEIRFDYTDGMFTWNSRKLREKLGLDAQQEDELCFIESQDMTLASVTRKGAVTTLRRLAQTGNVVWDIEEQV